MDSLPEELLLYIILLLDPLDVAHLQLASRRLLKLGRDNQLWKDICFSMTRDETRRRREELLSLQEPALAALRTAMTIVPELGGHSNIPSESPPVTEDHINVATRARARAMASWDPVYPSEHLNMYREYVQRHADIHVHWLPQVNETRSESKQELEFIGMGLLETGLDRVADKIVAPAEDGTICLFDVRQDGGSSTMQSTSRRSKSLLSSAQSTNGPKTPLSGITTESIASEGVSVDNERRKAYIGYHDYLHEVDLHTLQLVNRRRFPFPITCLSAAGPSMPLTVGTTMTLHLHDSRLAERHHDDTAPIRCELLNGVPARNLDIFGRTAKSPVTLAQPGPTSILHLPAGPDCAEMGNDIWVAGRFTSLLRYDRRFWPKIHGTIFTGARLSSLTALPFPYVPRDLHLVQNPLGFIDQLTRAKAASGMTLIACGEYKGKGSLELYDCPPSSDEHKSTLDRRRNAYYNRQTAAKSRLLSVAAHGARIVFSDGDGNLKWTERDGSTEVRRYNINGATSTTHTRIQPPSLFADPSGGENAGDIVQKLLPTRDHGSGTVAQDRLLLWTGEGRIGILGFGAKAGDDRAGGDVVEDATVREEREYGESMRRALEHQANEARYVRGLGLTWGI